MSDVPAQICFEREGQAEICTPLTKTISNESQRTAFHRVTSLTVRRVIQSPLALDVVLSRAETTYPGDGKTVQYALWSYARSIDAFQPLATFQVTEQGEVRFFDTGPLAGCAVVADYVLGPGESRFAHHRFSIAVRRLDPVTMTYTDVLRYVTAKRYPSLDDTDSINVIGPEMPDTLRILHYLYPHAF